MAPPSIRSSRETCSEGVEFSKRDLTVPFIDLTQEVPAAREADWDEYLGRAYLFWTPHPWLALRAEYIFERVEREAALTLGVKEADTHRVPLGVSFFHPSGLSATLTATYFNQDGTFERTAGGETVLAAGSDSFWTVDMAVSYRLPKRYGFITVGVTNLFDEEFRYFDTNTDNPSIQPARAVFARVTLVWP